MQSLRAIGRDALPDFDGILGFSSITGLLIETDPVLRLLWRIRTSLTARDWEALDTYLASEHRLNQDPWVQRTIRVLYDSLVSSVAPHQPRAVDPHWTCETYKEILRAPWRQRGADGPGVVFTVLYDPGVEGGVFDDLAGATSEMPWHTRLSARPVAIAQANPKGLHRPVLGGVSVGQAGRGTSGTLGGFVEVDGAWLGVTCGHVIDKGSSVVQPSEPDGGAGMTVGTCPFSTAGTLSDPGEKCRARGPANVYDVALANIASKPASRSMLGLGRVTRTASIGEIAEDDAVVILARSGSRRLVIGAYVLRRTINIDGTNYCFEDLFELRRPGEHWGVSGTVRPPTQGGDSGAWVLRFDNGEVNWLGMVTAGDSAVSYAQFAENVEDWARTAIVGSFRPS